jgi:deoxyuridine 5'-triphosphate nucleotidohydrolase
MTLSIIDSCDKAYLLGLIYNNIKNTSIIINNICEYNDAYVYNLIKKIALCDLNYYNFTLSFEIGEETLNDINKHFKNFFSFEEDDLKIAFIRGYYEGSKINDSNDIKIKYDNINDIIKIANHINIPYKINTDSNYIAYESGCNSIDFLGKIYNDCGNLCITAFKSFNKKKVSCKILKDDPNAIIPTKARESDVGYDLTIIKEVKKFNDTTYLYDTGIKIELENYYYATIVPRSSLSKSGYILTNSTGIIDNSYRGNLLIALTKIDEKSPDILLPFKCCQLIIQKQIYLDLYEVKEDFKETDRNSGGFGSSG